RPRAGQPGSDALDAVHHAEPADAPDHVGQVLAVAHFDGEFHHRDGGIAFAVLHRIDVGIALGHRRRHLRQHAGLVVDLDAQGHAVVALHFPVPGHGHAALGRLAVLGGVRAVGAVHHYALARAQVTHDLVAGNGMAADG